MGAKKRETTERSGEAAGNAGACWRTMFVDALPLLEWVAAHGSAAGPERQDAARRLIVRHYIAATSRPEKGPGLSKTKLTS